MNFATQWTTYRTRFLVRARQLTEALVFTDCMGREQRGQPGDYLVETSDGFRTINSRKIFEDIYVPLFKTSGTPVDLGRPPIRSTPDRTGASA